jgi:hypothetical protein
MTRGWAPCTSGAPRQRGTARALGSSDRALLGAGLTPRDAAATSRPGERCWLSTPSDEARR